MILLLLDGGPPNIENGLLLSRSRVRKRSPKPQAEGVYAPKRDSAAFHWLAERKTTSNELLEIVSVYVMDVSHGHLAQDQHWLLKP